LAGSVRDCSGNPFCNAVKKDCSEKPDPQGNALKTRKSVLELLNDLHWGISIILPRSSQRNYEIIAR